VGQNKTQPKTEKIIPDKANIKIRIVMGAKNGTIKMLVIGEVVGM